jgi:quinol monooxygenase YgiN
MNGLEKLYFCKNTHGWIYLTSPQSPVKPGFTRYSTTVPAEMDKVFAKLAAQTRAENENLTYALYMNRKHLIDKWRSDIRARMISADCGTEELDILRAALAACDRREEKLNRNSVYGVSAMQTTEANPKAPGDNRVYCNPPSETVN